MQRRGMAAEQQRLHGIGRREHDGAPATREQLRQLVAELFPELEVEIGERLVEQHETRILDQRAGKRGALLLAARELGRPAFEHGRQPQELGHAMYAVGDFGLLHPRHAQRRGDVLEHREIRIVDELLIDHRDVPLLHGDAGHILSIEPDFAGGRALQPRHQLHQRRLAGQRRPEEDVEAVLGEPHARFVDVRLRPDPLDHASQLERHVIRPRWPSILPRLASSSETAVQD